MQDINTLSLRDITPQNIAEDENVSALITAIDPQLQQISRASIDPLILARIDELPEKVLDILAWQLHADFYDLAATIGAKRQAVKNSISWHMHKGTEWAIVEALKQIDISAEFVPWWKNDGQPYTFNLDALVIGDFYKTKGKDRLQSSIHRAVEESKSARSYLADLQIRIEDTDDLPLYVGVAAIESKDVELGVDLEDMQELLRRFEERIMNRLDEYEQRITLKLNKQQEELNLQLEDIKDMLRWKGNDEIS